MYTNTPTTQLCVTQPHTTVWFHLFPFFLLTQTNQCTCVLTPKSHSLTCPRVFTSILEGLTSVETNCLIELQHQHSAACLYQLCSFFNNTATLLTSVKNLQAPQICQAFHHLETEASKNEKHVNRFEHLTSNV